MSNIEREPPTPRAEFLTAIVGPLTSLVLGVGFLLIAGLLVSASSMFDAASAQAAMAQLGPLPTLLVWLGPINVTIGLFNLLPGFPLDGGRVLRSILWKVTGDLRRATRMASATGQVIGWSFIVMGLAMSFGLSVPFFGTGLGAGLWLAFIGWFLNSAAAQTTRRLAIDELLAGHTVQELMRGRELSVSPQTSVATLVHDYFVRSDERTWPVVQDDKLVGIVSIADVREVPPQAWASTPVGAIMKRPESLALATPEEPLAQAFADFMGKDVSRLPVVENGSFLGVLERRDLTRWLELGWHPVGSH